MQEQLKKMREYLESELGKKSMEEWALKMHRIDERKERWIKKFNDYLKPLNDEDFDILMEDFTIWEEKYDDMWYNRGTLTYSNILSTLFDTAETFGTTLETEEMFEAVRHEYRGYVFSLYQGQGSIIGITYKGKRIF